MILIVFQIFWFVSTYICFSNRLLFNGCHGDVAVAREMAASVASWENRKSQITDVEFLEPPINLKMIKNI